MYERRAPWKTKGDWEPRVSRKKERKVRKDVKGGGSVGGGGVGGGL
jgi:hypothetical protein